MPAGADMITLPQLGEVVAGKYRIERLLGEGGMGAVYQAHHEILGQKVALKFLLPSVAKNPQAVSRFLNEARAAARITNEHVAKVLDVDTSPNGGAYLVLEFLEGSDLAALLEARPGGLPIGETVDFVLQAMEAVAQAHALGIVHRDLKPANLFLTSRFEGTSCVKVLDFGISKAVHSSSGLTATNSVLGSPFFMAPEQIRNSKAVDCRADIWSIGVILYKMLADRLPFEGEAFGEIFAAILEQEPAPLRQHKPGLPEGLERVVARCLQRDRELRYANLAQLAEELEPFAAPDARPSVDRIRRILASGAAQPRTGELLAGPSTSSSVERPRTLRPAPVSEDADAEAATVRRQELSEELRALDPDPGPTLHRQPTPQPAEPDSAGRRTPAPEEAGSLGAEPQAPSRVSRKVAADRSRPRATHSGKAPVAPEPAPAPAPQAATLEADAADGPDVRTDPTGQEAELASQARALTFKRILGSLAGLLVVAAAALVVVGLNQEQPSAPPIVLKDTPLAAPPAVAASPAVEKSGPATAEPKPKAPTPKVLRPAVGGPEAESNAPHGQLDLDCKPACEVELDGEPVGSSPLKREVAAGVHKLKVANRVVNLRLATTIEVEAGQTTVRRINLVTGTVSDR